MVLYLSLLTCMVGMCTETIHGIHVYIVFVFQLVWLLHGIHVCSACIPIGWLLRGMHVYSVFIPTGGTFIVQAVSWL